VCDVNGKCQGFNERGRFARGPGLAIELVRQAAPLNPFHGQEEPAVMRADFVELHDIGMLDARRQLCLQPETKLLG
jgi:hypothetical protein